MGTIKAGVVVVNQYCKPDSKIYSGYIKYMDRKEAVRTMHTAEFDMFNDYMGNPDKTSGLFTEKKRNLTECEIVSLKNLFQKAQDNGSYMWQTVISFDNLWLEQFGLYDSQSKILYEEKIKELATNGILKMLHNEKLDHAIWSAAIHYNTDNIHVHVATVEVEPMREKKLYQQYDYKMNDKNRLVKDGMIVDLNGNPVVKEEMKGKFSTKSFELCKQYIVNEVIKDQSLNKEINMILRDKLVRGIDRNEAMKDKILAKQLLNLREQMPDCNKSLWNYNSNIMQPFRDKIDEISRGYLERNFAEEYRHLEALLHRQSELYRIAYGDSKQGRNYAESKMQDLQARMGNSLLKVIRNMDTEEDISQMIHMDYIPEENREVVPDISLHTVKEVNDYIAFQIGKMNNKGSGTTQDFILDAEYFGKSGTSYAKYILGEIYFAGLGVEQSYQKAAQCYRKALSYSQSSPYAAYRLGDMYKYGFYYEKNDEIADKYYAHALRKFEGLDSSKSPDMFIKYKIGYMYYEGLGTNVDLEKAEKYLKEAESFGNENTDYILGCIYLNEGYSNYNLNEGMRYLEKSAEKENEYAQYRLGCLYVNPDLETYDLEKGMNYLRLSAEQGNSYAECKIGDVYFYQMNDSKSALKHYMASSRQGNSLARSRALNALVGTGMGQNKMRKNWEFDKALRDLKKSFQKDFKAWKNILEHDREFEKQVRNGQEDVLET